MGAKEERGRMRGATYGGVVLRLCIVTVARSPLTHLPFYSFELFSGFGSFFMAAV